MGKVSGHILLLLGLPLGHWGHIPSSTYIYSSHRVSGERGGAITRSQCYLAAVQSLVLFNEYSQ